MQELGERHVAIVDGEKERRPAHGVALVDIRARGTQHRHRLNVVLVDGEDQRRVAVAVDVVDRRARSAQHRDRLVVAVLASDE